MATQQIPRIDVQMRQSLGTRDAARVRKAGRLPVVIYGKKKDPVHASADRKALVELLSKNTHLLEVVQDAQTQPCLIKDVQWDHLGSQVIHVDLTRVDLNERVVVTVRLEFTGEAIGLKEAGAFLEHPNTEIEVECLATQIPEMIKVDVANLEVGKAILVRDIKLAEGVVSKSDPEMAVASIHIAAEEVVEEAVPAEAGAAEPEVIGRKVAEGEEGEEGAAPAAGDKGKAAAKPEKGGEKK